LLQEGQIFDGTYRLLRLVGEGGMGVVYEATHARLAGRYAIKVLPEKLSEHSDALARFDCEARITSLLQHPNVVQVIDHNTAADGTEYLVMEYLAGESLGERLARRAPLPLDTVVGIVDQIAAGLAAAHAQGIVHRDLKPENVFLVPVAGRKVELVKILDFGISKASWGLQPPDGELCGTPEYMAPEQVEGRMAELDAATDQFALAVIAYEMLTGRNPFLADGVAEILSRVARVNPPPAGIGPDVDAVLRQALSKSKAERFPSVTDFSDALRAAATVRESQRPATLPDAAGEIAKLDGRPSSRRRNRGVALAVAMATGVSLSFLMKGPAGRLHWPGHPLSATAAPAVATVPKDPPRGPGVAEAAPRRQVVLTDGVGETPPQWAPDEAVQPKRRAATAATNAHVAEHAADRTLFRWSSIVADRRSRHLRQMASSGSPMLSRPPHSLPAASALPPDEDATMPLNETDDGAR
jgi:tRNA A-37 threonylcarbamoyl transferase component Bud32